MCGGLDESRQTNTERREAEGAWAGRKDVGIARGAAAAGWEREQHNIDVQKNRKRERTGERGRD